jgi:hypothetical protein
MGKGEGGCTARPAMTAILNVSEHSFQRRWQQLHNQCQQLRVVNLFNSDSGQLLGEFVGGEPRNQLAITAAELPRFIYFEDVPDGGFVHAYMSDDKQALIGMYRSELDGRADWEAKYPDGCPQEQYESENLCEPGLAIAVLDLDQSGQILEGEL